MYVFLFGLSVHITSFLRLLAIFELFVFQIIGITIVGFLVQTAAPLGQFSCIQEGIWAAGIILKKLVVHGASIHCSVRSSALFLPVF